MGERVEKEVTKTTRNARLFVCAAVALGKSDKFSAIPCGTFWNPCWTDEHSPKWLNKCLAVVNNQNEI